MEGFDSSDDENQTFDETDFVIDWIDVQLYGYSDEAKLGISALPGCRFKNCWRDIQRDIKTIKSHGIDDVFVLCTLGELNKYRSRDLLALYQEGGITVHHHPILDGAAYTMECLLSITDEIKAVLKQGKKTLVHCYGGLGRSCLVVGALLVLLDDKLTGEGAVSKMRQVRGKGAIQSVKQYIFMTGFRELLSAYHEEQATNGVGPKPAESDDVNKCSNTQAATA